ncbi:hypothetical protein CSB93_0054 [Pseudomonas paraeruginosa]|uniref:Uncharacterized protein n=1 Tax=Pseudomonas paraeruginosa TaxID=2994495 RepID=A0A2R3IRE2_9PSED|nr:hypothetical protein CSB93_0054 [Pseudomonas paraeruginosa]
MTASADNHSYIDIPTVSPEPTVIAIKGGLDNAVICGHGAAFLIADRLPTAIAVGIEVHYAPFGDPTELSFLASLHT